MTQIKKIIVELNDHEATFQDFDSIEAFHDSDLYKAEIAPAPEVPVDAPEVASEAPVEPTV